jgi:uncharacterized protein (DUF362 family)/ferredoxin
MSNAPVSIAGCPDYEADRLATAVSEALALLGGMSAFVGAGTRVLLKPNLLMKAVPERAVTTHPELLRAVIREVAQCSPSEIVVGDSPGGRNSSGSIRRLWEECGLASVCAEEGARLVLFDDETVRVPSEQSKLYGSFVLGAEAVRADVLINLPKLKTHGFMQYTGAVKNLFGCIPGLAKAQFHLTVPDRDDFADMLVDLALACPPHLTIMDAVVGMEGEGPAGGKPVEIGAVLASADPFALDLVAASAVGFDPERVYTCKSAHRRGLAPKRPDDVEVLGVPWRELAPASFAKPMIDPFAKLPPWVSRSLRASVTAKPELTDAEKCTGCATCRENCPVGAIEMRDHKPSFDYNACIRCYCCQELCPPQVLGLRSPWLLRLFSKLERGQE